MDNGLLHELAQQTTDAAGHVSGMVNYSFSLGDLTSIVTTIIAVVAGYTRLTERLKAIEIKIDVLWDDYRRRSRLTRS